MWNWSLYSQFKMKSRFLLKSGIAELLVHMIRISIFAFGSTFVMLVLICGGKWWSWLEFYWIFILFICNTDITVDIATLLLSLLLILLNCCYCYCFLLFVVCCCCCCCCCYIGAKRMWWKLPLPILLTTHWWEIYFQSNSGQSKVQRSL